MVKPLHAAALALALVASCASAAGVIDETATMAPTAPGAAGMGAGLGAINAPMRTAVSLGKVQRAFETSDPRDNVKVFQYDRATIYKLRLREFMSATVSLPRGEMIAGWRLSDEQNFTFTPMTGKKKAGDKPDPDGLDRVATIQPKYPGADTNLTIFGTSGRVYPFYLRVDSVASEYMPIFVAYIEDWQGDATSPAPASAASATATDAPPPAAAQAKPVRMTGEEAAADAEYLRSLPIVDPKSIRLDGYRVAGGDKSMAPIRIFDDGYWTYFQLSTEKNLDKARVPAIYRVVDGYDTPVNTRIEGGTIIAESMSKGWTLRSGETHLCVRAK